MTRRSQFFSAAVCAMTLLLMTGHSLAQDTANVAMALAARARRPPATPLQMALRLEKEQAQGAGALTPIPDRQTRLDGGVIPLDGKTEGFPAEFFKGLVPERINGVEAWRVTLRADDASGDIFFYNADGKAFWAVTADAAVWSADWIARLHSPDCKAADFFDTGQVLQKLSERPTRMKLSEDALYRSAWMATRQYFLPSHVEMAFTFILKEDLAAYRSAGSGTRSPAATVLSKPMSMSAPLTGLAVTGIAADTNGVALSAAWPAGTAIAGDALDIFFTRTLIPPAWSNLWRVAVDPAAGAVDVAIPRSELPPAPEAPPAACVTNIVPSAYDPGVMVTNIVCTNGVWLTDSGFFRLADLADTDGDGLTDACEKWMYGTRSDLIDTDGDTLVDGWEIKYGLSPFVQDDPAADPDHDGLTHAEECAAGTDPFNGDTDGDGLKDGAEVFAAVARNAGVSAFNVAGGTDLTALLSSGGGLDEGVAGAPLPFPVVFGGTVLSNLSANANGLFGFYPSQGGLGSGLSGSQTLEDYTAGAGCGLLVAGFWDDLQLYPDDLGSAVTLADVTTNGSRFCVIECRNAGFYNVDPSTNDTVSFQIVFEQGVSNKVSVCFQTARGRGEGVYATLGAQTDRRTLQYAYHDDGSAYAGLALSYLFGLGTDPLVKDSDGDGLEDGDEVNDWGTDPLVKDTDKDGLEDGDEAALGTSPTNPDTDGDGMADGWEAGHSLDPLSPDGVDGTYGDPDADGLPNIGEFRAGTDPHVGDWDGDSVPDGDEAAWWETIAPLPWLNVTGGTVVLQNSNLDIDLFFAALPFPVSIAGAICTNAALDINGIAYLLDSLKLADGISSLNDNEDMAVSCPLTGKHFAVAAHWENLRARTTSPATRITVADVTTNGARYCVIEYRDMGFSSNSSARVSFQIVIPENDANTVCVRYADVAGANSGGAATLGAQGPGAAINIPVSFDRPFITNGLTLAYHFGSGGSPFVKDTDGDGLEDGAEAALGTSPANTDSDGDGLPDKWETDNTLDPLSAADADGDPDGDGVVNAEEFRLGTVPRSENSDGDTFADGEEAGRTTPDGGPIPPWLGTFGGTLLSAPWTGWQLDYGTNNAPLPFPVVFGGRLLTAVSANANGIAGFSGPAGGTLMTGWDNNTDIGVARIYTSSPFLFAAFWDNLKLYPAELGSAVTLADVTTNGQRYCVLEYRNMGFYSVTPSTNDIVSFQIAFRLGETNRATVLFRDARGRGDGRSATVGFQTPSHVAQHAFETPCVSAGLGLVFRAGTGTDPSSPDPQNADSDGDGLPDHTEFFTAMTDPLYGDSDGDTLPDGWEAGHQLDPLSPTGDGDPDGDGLLNRDEFEHNADPHVTDKDEDGLTDLEEVGGVTPADIPWFDLSAGDDITPFFSNPDYSCLTVPLTVPAVIRGAVFTNLTLDVNGLVYLNPTGYQNTVYSINGGSDMAGSWTVNDKTLTLAPFWSDLVLVTNTAPASKIISGTATDGTNQYRVIEYRNMRRWADRTSTNTLVSFQIAVPTGVTDRVFARYALATGNNDGRYASVGVQGVGGSQNDAWGFNQAGRVWPGLSLAFVIGTGSNPQKKDTDDDGLTDAEEAALDTNPANPDTDNDQMSDGWERDNGFNPLVNNSTDGDSDNDADADPDGDGLTNSGESILLTDPFNPDSDGDGVTDGGEVGQGHDPLDPEDTPSSEWFTLTGNLAQGVVKTLDRTFQIPAGQSRLIVVALQSDEYPRYTGGSSEFNDILTWNVTPETGSPISGSVDVNSRHSAWDNGIALNGYDPVCVEVFGTFTAPAGAPMTVTVHLTAKNVSDSALPSTVMVGVLNAVFVDKVPSYSLDQGADSDNFFLREKDGAGNPDHENLDIYYSLGLSGLPVSDVKVKVYKGESSTPEATLDGEKDVGGSYKTGDGLHITWTPEIDNLSEDHPGFYRLQLVVSVEGQGSPVLETSVADADSSTPGWQCPQDCLAVHDLVWKHRPIIHCHPDELGRPSNLDRFMANTGGHTKELAGGVTITNTPPAMPGTVNTFYDLFDDGKATIGDLDSDFTAGQRSGVLATAPEAETVYHTAVPPNGTGGASTHTFLQYWMFYNFSTRMFGTGIDADPPNVQHEGDVEHCQIAVRLKDPAQPSRKADWITPFGATASQHYYAQTLRWDLDDGSAAANSHVQTHVQHQDNRLVIYVAQGAHATYFVADDAIPVPVVASQYLGTQTMYDETAYLIYDLTVIGATPYTLRHVAPELKTFNGRFGFFNPTLTGLPANENGPAGLPHRAARNSSAVELNLRDNARELHNRAIKTVAPSQTAEMTIQP